MGAGDLESCGHWHKPTNHSGSLAISCFTHRFNPKTSRESGFKSFLERDRERGRRAEAS